MHVDRYRFPFTHPRLLTVLMTLVVFTKCAENLENGRRLENFSWRLWYREAHFFDEPTLKSTEPISFDRKSAQEPQLSSSLEASSDLSESVESVSDAADSNHMLEKTSEVDACSETNLKSRPTLTRKDSSSSYSRRQPVKHLSPDSFKSLISSLEPSTTEAEKWKALKAKRDSAESIINETTQPAKSLPEQPKSTAPPAPAVPTDIPNSRSRALSETQSSPNGTSARSLQRVSSSIVRGFTPEHPSISRRLTPLEPTEPEQPPEIRKKPKFFIASSASDSDEEYTNVNPKSNLKPTPKSNISPPAMKRAASNGSVKKTHFRDVVDTKILSREEDEEEDDDSAVVSDDEDEEWEDSQSESGETPSDEHLFDKREDTHLTSQPSMLSNLFKSKSDYNLSSQAFRSSNLIRNRASPAQTPRSQLTSTVVDEQPSFRVANSNLYSQPIPASPRTTRRKMLASELSESLRRNLLWERQHRTMTNNNAAAIKRRHTSNDLARLKEYPEGISGKDPTSSDAVKYAFDSNDAVW